MPLHQQLVIFDMDGTLIRTTLDFDRIRHEIGLPPGPILESLEAMTPQQRREAEMILQRHEAEAAATSELQPGAESVVGAIRRAGMPIALMTRNSATSVEMMYRRHRLAFDLVWTRDDGPMKPAPEPVLAICRRFEVDPAACWVVGDYHFDILCGRAAGARTVLMLEPQRTRPPWADEADIVIRELTALLPHLGVEPPA